MTPSPLTATNLFAPKATAVRFLGLAFLSHFSPSDDTDTPESPTATYLSFPKAICLYDVTLFPLSGLHVSPLSDL